jgi:hypothetical protein
MMKSKSQTLITGLYRSGTEYITHLIDSHPSISATMYRINILRFAYKKNNNIIFKENYRKVLTDLNKRLKLRYNIKLNTKRICDHIKTLKTKVTYGKLYDIIMSDLYLKGSIEHWAEKNQLMWREIPEFIRIMPNGKAIIIVRDPRSILASWKNHTYAKKPLYLESIFNSFDLFNFIKKNKKLIKKKKLYIVQYEKVLLQPKSEINKIFKFLNIPCLKNIKINERQLDAYGNIWKTNSSFEKSKNPRVFDKKLSKIRWKKNLSDEEILVTEMICSEYMKYFGYKSKYKIKDKKILKNSLNLLIKNKQIEEHLKTYFKKREGIQKFPTNPLDPKNWSNN